MLSLLKNFQSIKGLKRKQAICWAEETYIEALMQESAKQVRHIFGSELCKAFDVLQMPKEQKNMFGSFNID
jgi:hypothetical protein